jgi:DNA-directed RNA polymerase subunit RPC12/RpoP
MTDDIKGKVVQFPLDLPIRYQSGRVEQVLNRVLPSHKGCRHERFVIDERLAYVRCADCREKIDPMFALLQLCRKQGEFMRQHERYRTEIERLAERRRTKCTHCGQMTRISES